MSQEDVRIENLVVERWFWAFENDVAAFRDLLHPHFEWFQIEEHHSPIYGIDAAVEARNQWLDTWDEHRFHLKQVFEADDSVIVSVHITARGRASEVPVEIRFYAHYKLLDGKVVYIYDHGDMASALEAVGLSG
jgi:ketosteroid isomerase-like protein